MASRLNASYVSILQRFCDVVSIYISLYIVFYSKGLLIDNQALLIFLTMISLFQLIGGITDFYRSWRGVTLFNEIVACLKNIFFSIFFLIPFVFLFSDINFELLVHLFIVVFIVTGLFRVAIRLLYSLAFKFLKKSQNVIIIGDSKKAGQLFEDLKRSEWIGYNPIGIYSFDTNFDRFEFSGNYIDALNIVKENQINKVYVIVDNKNIKKVDQLLKELSDSTCSTIIVPELFSSDFLYSRVEDINGIPIIPIIDTRISGINIFLKRIEDLLVGSTILFLISPILLIIACLIKLDSQGPVFFKQMRYGLNGKSIAVYKFRTMHVMENGTKVVQATKNDPRVTRVGRILRRTSLDELPQFINVLFGTMSVVGPRPHAVAHNEEYRKLIPGYMLRHKVKPGITGLAQIRGWRGETDTIEKMEKRVECDLEYIRSWSLLLDIKIILITVFKGFIHKSAY